MALKFFNIRSGETRLADTEPKISALWGSSDRSPNASEGQDFGWRLAPEVVVELKKIKQDFKKLESIATRYNLPVDAVDEKVILQYISDHTSESEAPVAEQGDYEDEYDQSIRALEGRGAGPDTASMSDEELEAEMARRKAARAQTTTTTTAKPETVTTTTTKKSA